MINKKILESILREYKQSFKKQWSHEKYKWEAIQCFQNNWNIDADNFVDMLKKSFAKTDNLLASANNFPKGMLLEFAEINPEEVRAMFIDLFDEGKEVYERINAFKKYADSLHKKHNGKQHFQSENSITTYLWLRYYK